MIVESHRDFEVFDRLADEWNILLDPTRPETIFLRVEWQRLWWTHLARGDLCIITIRDDEKRLVGIASWFVEHIDGQRVLVPIGCIDVTDYLDVIYPREQAQQVLTALVEFLDSEQAPTWDTIELCDLLTDSPTLTHLPDLAKARGWRVTVTQQDVAPAISLPEDFDTYLAGLEKKQRHELRRKMRRAQELPGGVEMYTVGPQHDLTEEINAFFELMAISAPHKAEFLTDEGNRAFLEGVARLGAEQGWLRMEFLRAGDRRAAVLFGLIYNQRTMVYNSGVDMQAFGRISPGWVLIGYSIRNAIQQGMTHYDFLSGDEAYKYRLGGQDSTIHKINIQRKTASS